MSIIAPLVLCAPTFSARLSSKFMHLNSEIRTMDRRNFQLAADGVGVGCDG